MVCGCQEEPGSDSKEFKDTFREEAEEKTKASLLLLLLGANGRILVGVCVCKGTVVYGRAWGVCERVEWCVAGSWGECVCVCKE